MFGIKALWSRYTKVDPGISLGQNLWSLYLTITAGGGVSAWLLTKWTWYWATFGWGGLAIGFLTSWIILAAGVLAAGIGFSLFRGFRLPPKLPENAAKQAPKPGDEFGSPTVTQSPPTLAVGLYVNDIRFTFDDLEKNRRAEMTMRVFNGTGHAVEFSRLSGQLTFSAPNTTDPARKGTLPTPTLRHDVSKTTYPLQEWFFILEQHVPAQEADKMLAMIAADLAIHIDLTGLDISVFPEGRPQKVERLPLWGGLSCRHGICFGRIIQAAAPIGGVSTGTTI